MGLSIFFLGIATKSTDGQASIDFCQTDGPVEMRRAVLRLQIEELGVAGGGLLELAPFARDVSPAGVQRGSPIAGLNGPCNSFRAPEGSPSRCSETTRARTGWSATLDGSALPAGFAAR